MIGFFRKSAYLVNYNIFIHRAREGNRHEVAGPKSIKYALDLRVRCDIDKAASKYVNDGASRVIYSEIQQLVSFEMK